MLIAAKVIEPIGPFFRDVNHRFGWERLSKRQREGYNPTHSEKGNTEMKNVKKTLNKAFTLIELVVVMAVIAILAGVSVGVYFGVINNANQSAVDQEAAQARDAILLQTAGLGYEDETGAEVAATGIKLKKAVTSSSDGVELTFSDSVNITDDWNTHDAADNALEALYLMSLSDYGAFPTIEEINGNDISFNALTGDSYAPAGTTEGEEPGPFTITISGFEFQNGNGSEAVIHFGD